MSVEAQRPNDFVTWIGRTRADEDDISAFPADALAGTLGRPSVDAAAGMPVPPLWHRLNFQPVLRPEETRHEGHARGDEFMPPISLSQRGRAGSTFFWWPGDPLRAGDRARRVSRIESNLLKAGRSGELVFVMVPHEIHNADGICLVHEHQSASRGAAKQQGSEVLPALAETDATWHRELVPDPILLFRFLALMCNSHRIHYECRYAIGEEQYPALPVHGPLIAVLLMDLLQRNAPDAVVRSLEFKAVRPLYVGRPLHLRGCSEGDKVRRWASDDENRLATTASAELAA